MKRSPIFLTVLAGACGWTTAFGQSDSSKLPRLDLFGGSGAKRDTLGYEGTPLAPKKDEKEPKKAKGQTEITALEATFDQKAHQAVFINQVVVVDPEFTVNCDRLIAYLKQPKEPAEKPGATPVPGTKPLAAKPAPADPPPAAEKAEPESKGGGLDHAIAEASPGNEVLITQDKIEGDGTITKNVGHAKRATYDANSGDIVLTGSPRVQQGINLCVAQSEETVMTLNRDGHMRVEGPHKTTIKDNSGLDAKPR